MRETRIMMGMPVTVEVPDAAIGADRTVRAVFDYFRYIDEKFSMYRAASELMEINRGERRRDEWSKDMRTVFGLAEDTKLETEGYFDAKKDDGNYDLSGIVKGWAIARAADIIRRADISDFFVDAGGDIQTGGRAADGRKWTVGIRNPWKEDENIKVVHLAGEAIATSGTYVRGSHIWNPKTGKAAEEIMGLTVIHEDIYEADRFATAAFAMGQSALAFIEKLGGGFEALMIGLGGEIATTPGFEKYLHERS